MEAQNGNKKEFIPALGYDGLTGMYDLTIRLTMPERRFRSQLIKLLDPKENERILEFGYGTGQNLIYALEACSSASYEGLDIDPKVRQIAIRKLANLGEDLPLSLYEGGQFPYADKSFDKVFSSLVFHQLTGVDKQNALNEIFRVLRPGGSLLIGDWGKAKNAFMRLSFYLVQLLDGFTTTADNVKGLLPDYIMKSGFMDVEEADFINTRIGTYSFYTARKPT